jgi:GTPase
MSKNPKVVIVGRMNVGKSTLFNRLSERVKSIVFDYEGVTRDFIQDTVCWQGKCFDLLDTGGISLRKTQDPLTEAVRMRSRDVVATADVVVFVCDGKTGILPEDREISRFLHSLDAPVILVVNKMDATDAQENVYEFDQLGHEFKVFVSASHGIATGDVLEAIVNHLPAQGKLEEKEPLCRVVLLGKPNVGKSSLMNLLLKKERSLVADIPGTTREAVHDKVTFFQEDIVLTDTAGVRRKRMVDEDLEEMMVKSSFRALKDADVVLLLVDASESTLSDQELKLAFYAFEHHKALMILFNKQDLVKEGDADLLKFNLEQYKFFIKKVETMNISCATGHNVGKLLSRVHALCQRHAQRFSDDDLTLLFKEALAKKPLFHKTNPLHVLRIHQIGVSPITILMIVNEPRWFEESQLAFFDNLIRTFADLKGVPIKFVVRKKD